MTIDVTAVRSNLWLALRFGLLATVFLASATVAARAGDFAGCFMREYSEGDDPRGYSRITVDIAPQKPPQPAEPGEEPGDRNTRDVVIRYSFSAIPGAVFDVEGGCRGEGGHILCSIDCDGGRLTIDQLASGYVLMVGTLRDEIVPVSSLVMGPEDGYLEFGGTHTLAPDTSGQCRVDQEYVAGRRVEARDAFRKGDYHPGVKVMSRQLAKLGFLPAPPVPLYTEQVVEAMRAFQASIGLPATGTADTKSLKLLNVKAETSGGC